MRAERTGQVIFLLSTSCFGLVCKAWLATGYNYLMSFSLQCIHAPFPSPQVTRSFPIDQIYYMREERTGIVISVQSFAAYCLVCKAWLLGSFIVQRCIHGPPGQATWFFPIKYEGGKDRACRLVLSGPFLSTSSL